MSDTEMADSQYANPPTPPKLRETYMAARNNLLPAKSGDLYEKSYNNFVKWQKENGTTSTSVRVLVSYFTEMSKERAPSTLWCEYSKLKSTLQIRKGIDIGNYSELTKLLKKNSKGYEPKKARAFTGLEVENFLTHASDSEYLFEKTALVVGILGACRREELTNMKIDDVELFYSDRDRQRENPMLLIRIPKSKNGEARSFMVKGEFYQIVRRYASRRPSNVPHNRLFLNYQKGHCTKQPVGINKMGAVPLTVARFLGLPDAERYTSHAIRHTGASLFVEGGGTMEDLLRLGGWKSTGAASGYVTQSKASKEKISDKITSTIVLPNTSASASASGSSGLAPSTQASAGPSFVEQFRRLRATNSAPQASPSSATISTPAPSSAASDKENMTAGSSFVDQLRRLRATNPAPKASPSSATVISTPGPSSTVSDKENMIPMENQMPDSKIHIHLSNCQNCTFTLAEPKDV